jgi:hypothetical protein
MWLHISAATMAISITTAAESRIIIDVVIGLIDIITG